MDSPLAKPTRIGAYDIVDVIGRGGMGTVYKGTDPRIGRSVAVKVLTAATDDPDLLQRFYREAKYTGGLQHQNIVTVYEMGHQDGVPYLVMEYLEGQSLDAIIATGQPMPMAEKLRIILHVCSGLSCAHKRDIVHRDVKPANIMILENGTAKLVDFGIARLGGNRLTRTGHIVGSLNYMSPEQLNGNVEVDQRTDVYSTGVVLFQLLTRVLPFDGGSTGATLVKILQEPPPPLAKYIKDCPPELESIIHKALAKNREQRYATADDLAHDVGRIQQQYEKQLLAGYLQQATDALQRRDFATARQQVLQVLHLAPQNTEGGDLLRLITKGQEQAQRALQARQFQLKAEAALGRHDFSGARQFVEEGLRFDPGSAELSTLQEAIAAAQVNAGRCREALRRAESALLTGNLDAASKAVEEASQTLPDDPTYRDLVSRITMRIAQHLRDQEAAREQRLRDEEGKRQRKLREEEAARHQKLREQEAAEEQKQFALGVIAIEKVMAEAHMLLFLGQVKEALQLLEKSSGDAAQLPPRWRQPFESLVDKTRAKIDKAHDGVTSDWPLPEASPTSEMPGAPSETLLMHWNSGVGERGERLAVTIPKPDIPADVSPPGPPPSAPVHVAPPEPSLPDQHELAREEPGLASGEATFTPDDWAQEQNREIAPELREFLESVRPGWRRPVLWLGIAAAMLAVVVLYAALRPSQRRTDEAKSSAGGASSPDYTYADINAEPWGTVKEITPASGDAQSVLGEATPLRVRLPAGQYNLTIEGPNHEKQSIACTVPTGGGTSCKVLFRKPDIKRLLTNR